MVYPIEDDQCLMDDIWLHNVKITEVLSESLPQFSLNLWVIKIYGISDPIQVMSAILAYLGVAKIQVDRFCFIRNDEDVGMASWNYVKSFLDLIIPYSTGFICQLIALSEDCLPAWTLIGGALLAHPIIFWIVNYRKDAPKTKSSSRHYSVYMYKFVILSIFTCYPFLIVSKFEPSWSPSL